MRARWRVLRVDGLTVFGLSSAPFVFTKAMRQLSRYFREECGYDLVQYIDDWCFVFDSKREAELASAHVKSTFEKWGLTTCPKKSTWTPTQKMKMARREGRGSPSRSQSPMARD